MKGWPWRPILSGVALFLLVLGIAPIAYFFWWGNAHNLEPISIPIPLKRGEYASPFFITDLDGSYQIEIYFLPPHRIPLELDWRIADESGVVIRSGNYSEAQQMGGNDAILDRNYRSKPGVRQRIIVNIHQDIEANAVDTRLHIGLPERGLGQAYGFGVATLWAAFVSGG